MGFNLSKVGFLCLDQQKCHLVKKENWIPVNVFSLFWKIRIGLFHKYFPQRKQRCNRMKSWNEKDILIFMHVCHVGVEI